MDDATQRKEARLARKLELERQREEILRERARLLSLKNDSEGWKSKNSSLSSAVDRAKQQIPEIERSVHTLQKQNVARSNALLRPYNGEMGIGSYEPWQLEHFYVVRDFVRSWIDEVLDFVVHGRPGTKVDQDQARKVAERFCEELAAEKESEKLLQQSLEIEKSVFTEVVYQAAQEIAAEIIALENQIRSMLDGIMLRALEAEMREADLSGKNSLVGNAFLQLKKERRTKGDVWLHTQTFQLQDGSTDAGVELKEEGEESEVFDGTLLSFHDITPFSEIPDAQLPAEQMEFQNEESQYWMASSVNLSTLPLPRRYRGISCSAVSSDESLIALGTEQGDIVIWDLLIYPPRILRTSRGKNSVVTELRWSIDSSRVVSLNEHGIVQIWSLGDSTTVPYDVKSFEPIEQNLGFKASALVCLLTLQPGDFMFSKGPFADSKQLVSKVTAVAFHPSTTLLGKQAFLVVGFDTGNILRLKYSDSSVSSIAAVQPNNGSHHRIGKEIEAELFKSHVHRVVLICFVNNLSPMVTVDDKGFVNLWEYSTESLTGFGWFVPIVKYQLHMMEITYEPVVGVEENILFSDAVGGPNRKQQRLRQEMIQKRKQTQKHINSLHLVKPWQTQEADGKVTHIYAPKTVPESGATFHCVTYHSTSGLLASYVTKFYKPAEVRCSQFILCKSNSAGTKLVFMLLFPKAVPREAHTSFVIINLNPVLVSKNYICVSVTEQGHAKCMQGGVCSFDLSRAIDATGSEYIIANVNGNISALSMTSGNAVMAKGDQGWVGCQLNLKKGWLPAQSKVQVASTCKGLQLMFYAKKQNSAILMHLTDNNTKEQRLRTWKAFQQWRHIEGHDTFTHLMQNSMRRNSSTFLGHPDIHVECFMESLVLDIIDDAIQVVEGPFSIEMKQTFCVENVEIPFLRRTKESGSEIRSCSLGDI